MGVLPRGLKKWEPLEVEWEDVFAAGAAHSEDFIVRPAIRVTLGYVVRWSETYLVTAETDDRRTALDDADCDRITQFPVAYIRRIKRLSRPAEPPPKKKPPAHR